MKSTLVLSVLAVVASISHCSVVRVNPRANLNVGYVAPGDRLLHRKSRKQSLQEDNAAEDEERSMTPVTQPESPNVTIDSTTAELQKGSYVYQPAIYNAVQFQDVVYRGNITTRITAIQASEVGATQWATAYVIQGGVGQNNVTVRFTSTRGYGYYYLLDVWGR